MDANIAEKAIELIKEAKLADSKEEYHEALRFYTLALEHLMIVIKYEKSENIKSTIRAKVEEYMNRAEKIKSIISNLDGSKKKSVALNGPVDDEQKLRSQIETSILCESTGVHWDDVVGLSTAKDTLKEAVVLPIKFPQMFKNRRPWSAILLYGPPGTGKSHLARAVATEANSTFFSISSSDLLSKWVGDSEKLVKTLFQVAREKKPSVIFIDEIDSLCSSRGDNESEASRRVKTEFLVQMSGVGNQVDGILILGATNYPWSLDIAIRRRFQKRIFINLPEDRARLKLFQLCIGNHMTTLKQKDWNELSKLTDGYSGSDIANLVNDALMEPVRIVQDATHYKKVFNPDPNDRFKAKVLFMPCSPGDPDGIEMNWERIDGDELCEPPVTKSHFLKALLNNKSTVNSEDLVRHLEWTKTYGQDG